MAKIAFQDKQTLIDQPSIAEVNKMTAPNVNEIKSSVNELYDYTTYSNNEIRVGTWIDGKPLYRKVITGTFDYAAQTITDIITGYDKVINYSGTITTPSGYITQIPEYTNANNYCYFVLNTANDDATLTIPSSFVGGTFILIVEYTKTTD